MVDKRSTAGFTPSSNWDTVALVQAAIGTENLSLPFFTNPDSYVSKNYSVSLHCSFHWLIPGPVIY